MKKNFIYAVLFAICMHQTSALNAQSIEDIGKECMATSSVARPNLLVSPFHVSASFTSSSMGREVAEKLIDHLNLVNCFNVNKTASDFIPGGTQVVITGDFKDYYTSEGALGKPRVIFDIEIRNAVTQEIIATKSIKAVGKLYLGTGNNKPLAAAWKQSMDESVIFLYKNLDKIALQAKAKESKEKVLDSTLYFQDRVKRKSVLDQMKDHADDRREEDRKRSLNLSDYYNDTVLYKEYPKKPSDKFLEYTINGKKYLFQEYASKIDNAASIHSYEGTQYSKNGLKIQVAPSTVPTQMILDIFYPYRYPKGRRFHFGNDSTYDARVPSERKDLTLDMNFVAGLEKISEWGIQRTAREKYRIFSTVDRNGKVESNIEGGYIQVIDFETGSYGAIEVVFKFRTKPYTDKDGKQIPAMKIEGRMRARGNYPVH